MPVAGGGESRLEIRTALSKGLFSASSSTKPTDAARPLEASEP